MNSESNCLHCNGDSTYDNINSINDYGHVVCSSKNMYINFQVELLDFVLSLTSLLTVVCNFTRSFPYLSIITESYIHEDMCSS